jgi:hypothetical protein
MVLKIHNNDNGGYYNASNHPNSNAFAALQADGSITHFLQ